jgi:hypothetical protein
MFFKIRLDSLLGQPEAGKLTTVLITFPAQRKARLRH